MVAGMRKLLMTALVLAVGPAGVALAAPSQPARMTSGEIYASLNHAVGGLAFADGDVNDKILGRGAIIYRVRVTSGGTPGTLLVNARTVTLYTPKGSISGTGKAMQTIAADGTTTVTGGSFRLTKGTGGLAGRKLIGTFSGDFKDGVYHFTYTGTYR